MVVVSYSGREINAKIVYYGPGLSGKTTNLEKIYDSVPETNRGRMVSMKTQTDRTLFFDLLPLDLGDLQGMKTRLLLYTVPGQVYYNATRKLVLKGVDAVVFVADSAADKMAENRESLANLEMNLRAYGIDIKTLPLVLQYNKRDLPTAVPVEDLNRELNRLNLPWFEAQAANGIGVFETLRGISKLLLARISKEVLEKDGRAAAVLARTASEPPRAQPPQQAPADPRGEKQGVGGKLLKYLKREKGAAPGETPEAAVPRPPAFSAEPSPLLSDEALVEDSPGALSGEPRSMNAEEELILSETDAIVRGSAAAMPEPAEVAETEIGDFERETSMFDDSVPRRPPAGVPREIGAGEARRISIPIELVQLPRGGTVTLTLEIQIRVDSSGPARPAKREKTIAGLDDSFSTEVDVIP